MQNGANEKVARSSNGAGTGYVMIRIIPWYWCVNNTDISFRKCKDSVEPPLQQSTMPAEKRQADPSFGSTEMVVKRQKAKYEGSEVVQINRTALEKGSLILGVSFGRRLVV